MNKGSDSAPLHLNIAITFRSSLCDLFTFAIAASPTQEQLHPWTFSAQIGGLHAVDVPTERGIDDSGIRLQVLSLITTYPDIPPFAADRLPQWSHIAYRAYRDTVQNYSFQ